MDRKRRNKARKTPTITWVMLGITIISILVAIILPTYFYFSSQAEHELVYAVNPVRTAVVTVGQATELTVLYKGEPLGNKNVTAAQVAIWNAGKRSIWKDDILGDGEVVIFADPPIPILEASIRQHSREITEFTLFATSDSLASGRVAVSWHILEKDDGASIQLIYEGTEDVKFQIQGVIEGQHEIKCAQLGVSIKTPQEQVSAQQSGRWVWGIMALASLAFVIIIVVEGFRKHRHWSYYVALVPQLVVLGLSVWQYFSISMRLWPPFGF